MLLICPLIDRQLLLKIWESVETQHEKGCMLQAEVALGLSYYWTSWRRYRCCVAETNIELFFLIYRNVKLKMRDYWQYHITIFSIRVMLYFVHAIFFYISISVRIHYISIGMKMNTDNTENISIMIKITLKYGIPHVISLSAFHFEQNYSNIIFVTEPFSGGPYR